LIFSRDRCLKSGPLVLLSRFVIRSIGNRRAGKATRSARNPSIDDRFAKSSDAAGAARLAHSCPLV
jgi:hypothetical protein